MHGLAALPNVGGDHEPGPRRELFEPLDIPQLEQMLERGTVPRQTRAVLAQAADMRSSRQAETLRAAAGKRETVWAYYRGRYCCLEFS